MKNFMIGLVGLACVEFVLLVIGSSWPAGNFLLVFPAMLLGFTIAGVWVMALGIQLLRRRPVPWQLAFAVPVIGILSIPAAFVALPVRFWASDFAFDHYVQSLELDAEAGVSFPEHPDYIGGYKIRTVTIEGEAVFFEFHRSGFIDGGGVAYLPNGEVNSDFGIPARRLAGNWWSIWTDF